MTIIIDERKCPALEEMCQAIPACPENAIRYEEDNQARLGGRIVISDQLCNTCGICVEKCCGQALQNT